MPKLKLDPFSPNGLSASDDVVITGGGSVSSSSAGVSSLSKQGDTKLTGDVTLSSGSNITLTQAGNDIEIASTGGGAVDSVNGQTGTVVLDADDIDDTSTTHKFATSTQLNNADSAIQPGDNISELTNDSGFTSNTGTVTSVGITGTDGIEVDSGSPITTSGSIQLGLSTTVQGQLSDASTAVQPGDLATVATTGDYDDLTNKPTIPTSIDNLSPSQAGNSGKFLTTDGTNASWGTPTGSGDMLASVYDPAGGAKQVAFEDDLTAHTSNTSNPHSVTKTQVGLSNVDNTSDINKPISTATQNALDDKEDIAKLTPIAVSVSTAGGTAAKVGTTTGGTYSPTTGDVLIVTFSNSNSADNPTLNIDGSGAKSILLGNINPTAVGMAGTQVMLWYDGTAYQLFGSQRTSDANTTYSEISEAEITAGTASTARAISGRRSQFIVDKARTNLFDKTTDDMDDITDGSTYVKTENNYTTTEKNKLSGIESGADVTDATNVATAGATMDSDTSLAGNGYFLDEDNMASDSATKVPSQQSVKAYVDGRTNIRRRDHTTNSTITSPSIQTGWTYLQGNNSDDMTFSITFPTAFSTRPVVTATSIGGTNGVSHIGSFDPVANSPAINVGSITTTGCSIRIKRYSGTFGGASYWGVSWTAIGES